MKITFTETETQVLVELREWAEKKYNTNFEHLDYKNVLNEFWKEKLQ